jgi:hypothetical protein
VIREVLDPELRLPSLGDVLHHADHADRLALVSRITWPRS